MQKENSNNCSNEIVLGIHKNVTENEVIEKTNVLADLRDEL